MEPTTENLTRLHRERMARARRMTPDQRLTAGPELFSLVVECMRTGVRLQHPDADDAEIRALVRERLARLRQKDERAFHATG